MKRKTFRTVLLFVIFSLLFVMTACNSIIPLTNLNTPTGLTVTDGVLHWNSVNSANAYIVNCNGVDVATVNDVRYPLTGLTSGNTYLYKVKAKHTMGAYNDSAYSETYSYKYVAADLPDDDPTGEDPAPSEPTPLLTPANLSINDGKLSWDAVDQAKSYLVSINGTEYTAATNELTVSSLKNGVYKIKIKAIGDGETHASSEYCEEMSVDLYDGSVCTTEQFGNFKDINQFESFLGYGFDVVADSIVSDRTVLTSFPIFNVDELLKMRFLKVNSKSSQVKIISEEKIENFIEQWNSALNVNVSTSYDYAKSVNVAGSVKLKNEFAVASTSAKSTHSYCITISDQKFYIVMQGDMDTYRGMLSAGFEKDLYDPNIDPGILFQRYGTHFITSAVMGGRMNAFYNMYSLSEDVTEKEYAEVATTISTSFHSLFSMDFDLSNTNSFTKAIEQSKSKNQVMTKESVDVMGGGDFGIATVSQVPTVYADWQKSLDAYPSLMGIKDSSSLIGIWELIDINRDTQNNFTWVDIDGEEKRGTRAEQLQAYFYKYGLDNYNQLMSASSLPEMVRPEAIGDNILIDGKETGRDKYFTVATDSVNKISFNVLPDNAVGYKKTYSLSEESKQYAYMENDELVVRPASAIPSDTVLYLTIAAGDVQKTLRIKVIKHYNITYQPNFTTDYTIDSTLGVLEGSTISPPVLMKKTVDGKTEETKIERFGYRLVGWASYQNGEYVAYDFSRPVASNLNLFAQWQKITNIVTFDARGGCFENGQTSATAVVDYDQFAVAPTADPTREHYIFQGWYETADGEVPFDFETTNIRKKVTVFAKWIPVRYTVSLDLDNGISDSDKAYTSAEAGFKITLQSPVKAYYDFAYWALSDGTEIDLNQYLFLKDTSILAVYTPTLYTVTFSTDGGTELPAQVTSIETNFLLPVAVNAPQKTGYTFLGWQVPKDGAVELMTDISGLSVKSDVTLVAVYDLNKYTVTFVSNGGNTIAPYSGVSHGVTITEPTAPVRENYRFVGWYKDETLEKRFLFEVDAVTDHLILYAKWTEEIVTYTVVFHTNIPNKAFSPVAVTKNTLLSTRYTEDMYNEREGYRFDGWFTDENFTAFFNAETTPITADTVLYAKWVAQTYQLKFFDGERLLDGKTYFFDEEVSRPENPQKEGHTFLGWSQEIPARMSAKNLNIYANFAVNTYTLSYYIEENGEIYREKAFKFGEKVNLNPNAPEKLGHTFAGWDKVAPDTMPANDVAIYAQWTKNKYLLTVYLTDSTDYYTEKFREIEVEYGAALADLTIDKPTASNAPYGYKFVSWNFGEFTHMPAHNLDASTVWEAITVNLTLHYGDDTAEYTATCGESLKPYLNDAVFNTEKYLFDGTWQYENGNTVAEDAVVGTADLVLIANSSKKTSVYSVGDMIITDSVIFANKTLYLFPSNFEGFNSAILGDLCGSVTLNVQWTAVSHNAGINFFGNGNSIGSISIYKDDTQKSGQVEIPYQLLMNGLEMRITGYNYTDKADFKFTNLSIEATTHNNYCAEMRVYGSDNTPSYRLITFDTLEDTNSVDYVVPTKASTTRTFTTSPLTVTGSVYYAFNGWKVNGVDINVTGNKLQLKDHFGEERVITLSGSFSESSYGDYKTSSTLVWDYECDDTITDGTQSKDTRKVFNMSTIKDMLKAYSNMRLTKIDIALYMIEIDDGYQEVYLTSSAYSNFNGNSHHFPDGTVIYSHGCIETAGAGKGEGWFNASQNVNFSGETLPDTLYMYFGAWGDKNDHWKLTHVKVTCHF